DHVCNPIDYVDLPGSRMDLRQRVAGMGGAAALIFGGGGLLHSGTVQQIGALALSAPEHNPHSAPVAWGLGANEVGELGFHYPATLREFDLVGTRDYGIPLTSVPCPRCLHPGFDTPRVNPTHEFIIYEHYDAPIDLLPIAPRMSNRGNRYRMREILHFL